MKRKKSNYILPRADKAVIPVDKIINYALNPMGDKNKAIAFEKALGYNVSNADKLINQIYDNINKYPAILKNTDEYGTRYEIIMDITGVNGKTAKVLTGWIDDHKKSETRLITIHVD